MTPKRSLDPKDIASLLSKLKEETPEYPAQMMEARKAAFLKQAANLRIPGEGNGGEGGSDAGNSGSGGGAVGGSAGAPGVILQALVAISVVGALIATAFAYRQQISEIVHGEEFVAVEETSAPPLVSTPSPLGTATSVPSETPIAETPTLDVLTGTPAGLEFIILVDGTPVVVNTLPVDGPPYIIIDILDGTKTNSGLHLGQTPGAPAAPGLGNPGNENQPDKPEKEDNPNKPDKPVKEDNPNKPEKPK